MLSPIVQKASDRLGKLIALADALPGRMVQGKSSNYRIYGFDKALNVRIEQAINDIAPASLYAAKAKKLNSYDVEDDQTEELKDLAVALKADLDDGDGFKLYELAHGEVYDDVLNAAEYLLQSGYITAACVTAGSAFESHLRALAIKYGVAIVRPDGTPLPASQLNVDLAKAQVYDANTSKQVLAWQALRNKAAHIGLDPTENQSVAAMILGLRGFLGTYKA